MKTSILLTVCAIIVMLSMSAQEPENKEKSLSPYFYVHSDDPETDRLPLKATEVQADIAGVIAQVTVRQTYKNEGQSVLEAIYVFPASSRAAVNAMKMSIGERTIEAKIEKKEGQGRLMKKRSKTDKPHRCLSSKGQMCFR